MVKKVLSLILAVILAAALSSCGYQISVVKKPDPSETTTAESLSDILNDPSFTVPDLTEPATYMPETATEIPGGSGADITVDNSFQPVPMSTADVIELYKRATNDIKLRAPGYIRTEHQDVTNVKAGSGNMQIFNNIMDLVATELLNNSGDSADTVQILAHDDRAVRKTFPLFGKDTGCELDDLTIVSSAVCYSDKNYYKLVITLFDQKDPSPTSSQFSKIMTPIDFTNIKKGIEDYLVVLDMNRYDFSANYTGNEIICLIDKNTYRLSGLTQKMVININIDLNMDLFFFQTKGISASGTVINHLEYKDFDWN